MNNANLQTAKNVLIEEADCLVKMAGLLGEAFMQAVSLMMGCNGRIVVTGIGKAGLVGRKISATLASTGSPSFFLHPAEGVHGDLGMVTPSDIILALSNSGESNEVLAILPTLKVLGTPIITITSKTNSTLAQNSDIILTIPVEREACPLGLAPTTSTTAMLALGDALAIVLLQSRKFTPEDFALYHPGGALGRKLLLTVERLMHVGEDNPIVDITATVKDAIIAMTTQGNLGATSIVDEEGRLVGILTDGDLRRLLKNYEQPLELKVADVMTKNPKTISGGRMAAEAMHVMEAKGITVLPVIDEERHPIGLIHLHDIIRGMTGLR
jgi:arabinose-5-phosphate isomerase